MLEVLGMLKVLLLLVSVNVQLMWLLLLVVLPLLLLGSRSAAQATMHTPARRRACRGRRLWRARLHCHAAFYGRPCAAD